MSLDTLGQLPKLNKQEYIQAYVNNQRIHISSYASPQKPGISKNIGFATPVLTARKPRVALAASKPAEKKENKKEPSKRKQEKSDDDDEEAARVVERRERKRVKRAIMNPPSEKEKKKNKKNKNPPAFALMHGFSATNVGKNRLTLKPPSAVGVFKKGKASLNAKTKTKSKAPPSKPFSEAQFLNSAKQAADSDASSQTSNSDIPQAVGPVKSEVWDIESRANDERSLSPIAMEDASASQVQGTVVLDVQRPAWGQSTVSEAPPFPSSPSLRPSESASQVVAQHLPRRVPVSRYFPGPEEKSLLLPAYKEEKEEPNSLLSLDAQEVEVIPHGPKSPLRFRIPARKRDFAKHFTTRSQHIMYAGEALDEAEDVPEDCNDVLDLDGCNDAALDDCDDALAGNEEGLELAEEVHVYLGGAHNNDGAAFGYSAADWGYAEEEIDDEIEDSEEDDAMTGYSNPIQFAEGRALLMGLARTAEGGAAEQDVARDLRGHWRPQRL
ncbi:hypothetical protein C8F01DRAFT_1117259 [Mycena amicta]|nr:hypothetical protein C8F01DRAFT_1117259 [Mycena amicta]